VPVRSTTERPDNVKSLDIGEDGEAVVAYQSGDVKIRQNRVWSILPHDPDIRDVAFVKFRSNRDLWVGRTRPVSLQAVIIPLEISNMNRRTSGTMPMSL